MTLVEVIVSTAVLGMIVVGTLATVLAFAKYSSSLGNRADFNFSLRMGLEKLAKDARNASAISSRTDTGFTLTVPGEGSVVYAFDAQATTFTRTLDGATSVIFDNVSAVDILTNAADQNSALVFSSSHIGFETLTLTASNGSNPDSALTVTDFSFKIRN